MTRTSGPPRAVTFDLWRTLMFEEGTGRGDLRVSGAVEVLRSAGRIVAPEAVADALRSVARQTSADHDRGVDRPFAERMAQILEAAAPGASRSLSGGQFEAFARAVDEPFLLRSPAVHAAAANVLSSIVGMGLRTALISNVGSTSPGTYRRYLEREGIGRYLDILSFSNELAVAKPAPAIFRLTLDRLGVAPGGALHVGDNLLADVAGAKDAGMAAAWVRGFDDREPRVAPDYTIDDLEELPAVVERWLNA